MKIAHLRLIDKVVGIPLCWALSRYVAPMRKAPSFTPDSRPNLLIIHLSEMGAMVLAQPALRYLQEQLPQANLYFLSFPPIDQLLQQLGWPQAHCFTINPKSFKNLLVSGLSSLQKLRSLHLDAVIDFEGFSRASAIISALVCPEGVRLGLHPYQLPQLYRGHILTHKVQYNDHLHASRAYLMMVQSLWADVQQEPLPQQPLSAASPAYFNEQNFGPLEYAFNYQPQAEALHSIKQKLTDRNLSGKRLVIVNPNSSDMLPLRRWDLDNYAQVCRALLEAHPDLHFVVTGTAEEKRGAQELSQALGGHTADLTGHTTIAELLALYSLCELMITNDSGPAHLASIANLPTVILFGPETPLLFAPLGSRATIIYRSLACSPCVSPYNGKASICQSGRCIKTIAPQTVIQAALQKLKS